MAFQGHTFFIKWSRLAGKVRKLSVFGRFLTATLGLGMGHEIVPFSAFSHFWTFTVLYLVPIPKQFGFQTLFEFSDTCLIRTCLKSGHFYSDFRHLVCLKIEDTS